MVANTSEAGLTTGAASIVEPRKATRKVADNCMLVYWISVWATTGEEDSSHSMGCLRKVALKRSEPGDFILFRLLGDSP